MSLARTEIEGAERQMAVYKGKMGIPVIGLILIRHVNQVNQRGFLRAEPLQLVSEGRGGLDLSS